MSIKTYKIIILGDEKIGKSKSICKLKQSTTNPNPIVKGFGHLGILNNDINNWDYHPTLGSDDHWIYLNNKQYSLCELAGNWSKTKINRSLYFQGSSYAIIFNSMNITSYINECINNGIPYVIIDNGDLLGSTIANFNL